MGNSNSSNERRRQPSAPPPPRSEFSSEFGVELTDAVLEEQRRALYQAQAEKARRIVANHRARQENAIQRAPQQALSSGQVPSRPESSPTHLPPASSVSVPSGRSSLFNLPAAPAHERRETSAQSANVPLPQVCRRHNTRQGCANPNCCRLHMCRLFLADICKHGVNCRYGHSLTTVHNQLVCNRYNLDTGRELATLQQLRRAFEENEEAPTSMYVRGLERCFKFGSKSSCTLNDCNRIHICRQYVAGTCARSHCKFGHDLHTTHNNGVLSKHRATRMSDQEIIEALRQKENKDQQVGDAVAPSAPPSSANAVTARQQASGGANKPKGSPAGGAEGPAAAVAGLSDELQCPVCLDLFSRATTLGCGHTFCAQCLQETRSQADKCPLCRAAITSAIRSVTLDNIIRNVLASQ